MLSRTQVINNALQMIAANRIDDPDEASESARQAKSVYDQTVREELEKQAWFFAKKQTTLPAAGTGPSFRFARAFTLPPDFIRLIELDERWVFDVLRYAVNTDPTPAYELQGRAIVSDLAAPLKIAYISDVTADPTVWSPLFAGTVASAMAVKLAMPLTKSEGMVSLANKRYQQALRDAKRSNAIQKPPGHIPDGSWIVSRYV